MTTITPTVSDLGSNGDEDTPDAFVHVPRPHNKLNSDQDDLVWLLSLNEHRWRDACQVVKDLTIFNCFEGQGGPASSSSSSMLALQARPTWIQTVSELADLEQQVLQNNVQLVAIDSGWWCPPTPSLPSESNCSDRRKPAAATQLAVCHYDRQQHQAQLEDGLTKSSELVISSWVIDLLYEDEAYQTKCKAVVRSLFENKLLLGFAVKQDIHKLDRWLQDKEQRNVDKHAFPKICTSSILDVQQLYARREPKHQPPGLAACVSRFTMKRLCKREQCSDWSQRPLTSQQLEYVALDAAVLLVLLAEIYRQAQNDVNTWRAAVSE